MGTLSVGYLAGWASACLVALALFLAEPQAYAFTRWDYWRFLGRPWKLTTFALAMAGLVMMAPYTGDPTWDYTDAGFMSVLTFCSAPWSVGVLDRRFRGEGSMRQAFVALVVWLFAAGWSYDLYLLLRDGHYPVTWWANLLASSVLYLCAGLFWNLDWRAGTGLTFAFMERPWPPRSGVAPFQHVALPAVLFMLLVSLCLIPFVLH